MKRLIFSFSLALAMLSWFTPQAQDRIAYLNSLEVIASMPEYETAMNGLAQEEAALMAEYEKMIDEYLTLEQELIDNGPSMMDVIRENKTKQLLAKQDAITTFEEQAQAQLTQSEEKALEPIYDKANTAIQAVAQELGYTYVLDVVGGSLLYAPDDRDISAQVKAKLQGM